MNILEAQGLCKTYGTGETEVKALNHMSFSVRKGGFMAIVGGAGSVKGTYDHVFRMSDGVLKDREVSSQ